MTRRRARIVLVHGTACTSAVWDGVRPRLEALGHPVTTPERPRSGNADTELEWLATLLDEATWLVGLSGGATLGLAAATRGLPMRGAVLHEPAVGSLCPGLLADVAAAFAAEGTVGLARVLYGPRWDPAWLPAGGDEVTARELTMFRGLEPGVAHPSAGRVLITTGSASPPLRHAAMGMLEPLGYATTVVPHSRHLVTHEATDDFVSLLERWLD